MARPQKSEEMHLLQGTKSEAQPRASNVRAGRPKYPAYLSKTARKLMKQACVELEARRALTSADGDLLAAYAVIRERWMEALEHLAIGGTVIATESRDKNGSIILRQKPSPWLLVAQTSERQFVAIAEKLGFTPSTRDRIKPAAPGLKGDEPKDNGFQEFIAKRKAAGEVYTFPGGDQ
jgi:P27 family predicted phage terminase small subunit